MPPSIDRLAFPLLTVLAVVFHLPRLDHPFGHAEVNGGGYFGIFVRQFQQFGFFELRGLPLAPQRVPGLAEIGSGAIMPYLNHPPGMTWAAYWLGGEEWAFRLPAVIAGWLGALALFGLLRRRIGSTLGLLAAMMLLGLPSMTLYSLASYEATVCGLGLCLWATTEAHAEARGVQRLGLRCAQTAICVLGVVTDWSFAFFCAGLAVLTASRSFSVWLRALWVPAIATALTAAAVFAWQGWALQHPLLGEFPRASVGDLVRTTILNRPELSAFLVGAWRHLAIAVPVALVVVGGVALLPALGTAPRFVLAALVAGLGQPLTFADHARTHVHFWCYTGALLTVAIAFGAHAIHRHLHVGRWRWWVPTAMLALTAWAWVNSCLAWRDNDTTLYRDLGQALTQATRRAGPDGMATRSWRVGTNFPFVYPYYVESPHVVVPCLRDPIQLEALRHHPDYPDGYRYVWMKGVSGDAACNYCFEKAATLDAFLERFPSRPIAELAGSVSAREALAAPIQAQHMGLELHWNDLRLVDVPPAHGSK